MNTIPLKSISKRLPATLSWIGGIAGVILLSVAPAGATNGSLLIGVTPASLGMGGTGVAYYTSDANAIFRNAALLSLPDSSREPQNGQAEFSLGYLDLSVKAQLSGTAESNTSATAPLSPNIATSYHLNPEWAVGLGLFPVGGAVTDFPDNTNLFRVKSNYKVLRLTPVVAYSPLPQLAFGFGPYAHFGSFALNHQLPVSTAGPQSTRDPVSATAFGYQLGIAARPLDSLVVGVTYLSHTRANYKEALDFERFRVANLIANTGDGLDDFRIQEPRQVAAGVKYDFCPELALTLDWRWIDWQSADGPKDLTWKNQNVYAIGTEYKHERWKFRAGFNYSKAPVSDSTGETGNVDIQGHTITRKAQSVFAAVGFPALVTTHYTVGVGYDFTSQLSTNFAASYSPEASIKRSGTDFLSTSYEYSSKVTQLNMSLGATYSF